jgi:futalosine hydrolase
MKILVTAAEQQEIDRALKAYESVKDKIAGDVEIVFRLTGIGAVNACYCVMREIWSERAEGKPYGLVINMGIAGSYDLDEFPIASAAIISKEYFGDLGFDTDKGFADLFRCGIIGKDEFPYTGGALARQLLPYRNIEDAISRYKSGVGVTIQCITGDAARIEWLKKLYAPHIESMEGAAVYYAALMEGVPCFGLRTVSNVVGERDSRKWKTKEALDTLENCCREIFEIL